MSNECQDLPAKYLTFTICRDSILRQSRPQNRSMAFGHNKDLTWDHRGLVTPERGQLTVAGSALHDCKQHLGVCRCNVEGIHNVPEGRYIGGQDECKTPSQQRWFQRCWSERQLSPLFFGSSYGGIIIGALEKICSAVSMLACAAILRNYDKIRRGRAPPDVKLEWIASKSQSWRPGRLSDTLAGTVNFAHTSACRLRNLLEVSDSP
jgi:hypothetical protein